MSGTSDRHDEREAPAVLLVERDLGFADSLAAAFGARGFAVRHAVNGAEAIDEITRDAPDLLVLDLDTPVIPGMRLLPILRRSAVGCDIAVLALATLTFGDARAALEAGADDVAIKPLPPDEVVAAGETTLARVRGWRHATVRPLERAASPASMAAPPTTR